MKTLSGTYFARKGHPLLLDVPPTMFLMVDGQGSPNSLDYANAIQSLYTIAYGSKFALRQAGHDFHVLPLETQWWSSDGTFSMENRDRWSWTAMIPVPECVTASIVAIEVEQARAKRGLPSLDKLHLGMLEEGLCAQVLHIGPYDTEPESIDLLHKFIAESGFFLHGKHHEIYLSDPRRTAPDRIRTIIRQPLTR